MRIGLPKGLLFYYYYPFWRTLFESLGFEVVESHPTSSKLVDEGVKVAVPEICVPIKVYSGHVVNLLEQDVDYIFVPRLVTIRKGDTFCPKFLGLPDMLEYTIPGLSEKLLAPIIRTENDNLTRINDYKLVWKTLGVSKASFKKALKEADRIWTNFRNYCYKGYTIDQATDLTFGRVKESDLPAVDGYDTYIGVIGYVYNIYDEYISMDIINKLRSMNVGIRTFEMVDESYIDAKMGTLSKRLFWTFTNKLWGAADNFYKDSKVDGLIHVTAFNCGPDSMLGAVMEMDSDKYGKPFMTIRVDEHTGENHLNTRVEAFVDMIKRKKQKLKEAEGL